MNKLISIRRKVMSENRKLKLSRRDFMRMSALAASGAALAGGLPQIMLAYAQGTEELTVMTAGRALDAQRDQSVVDAFNADAVKAGKPYRMSLVTGPATDIDYNTKLNLDFAGGAASDVILVSTEQYQDLVAAGYLADLTDMVNGWDEWAKYAPVIKDLLTINKKVYGISKGSAFTLFYRKDLLEKAGISTAQPQTWDNFFGLADNMATKIPGMTPAGLPAARPWGGSTWGEGFRHVWLGYAESNQIYDPADGKWVVSSDGLLKALQVYETLAKNKWLTVESLLSPNP
jgi:multiple sugar transport system substrate-binding protein